jgi:hypothetical protein
MPTNSNDRGYSDDNRAQEIGGYGLRSLLRPAQYATRCQGCLVGVSVDADARFENAL